MPLRARLRTPDLSPAVPRQMASQEMLGPSTPLILKETRMSCNGPRPAQLRKVQMKPSSRRPATGQSLPEDESSQRKLTRWQFHVVVEAMRATLEKMRCKVASWRRLDQHGFAVWMDGSFWSPSKQSVLFLILLSAFCS